MCGGKVIGIIRKPGEPTTLNVQEPRYRGQTMGVRVIERRKDDGDTVRITLGDYVWWQGDMVMLTPGPITRMKPPKEQGKTWDIVIPRVGYSFAT